MADTADTADTMANTANILARYRREADATSAEAGRNSAAANRQNTATGAAETGEAVIGAAIGNGGYWGGGSRFIFIGGGYPYYWNWYPYWGWRYPYFTTAIILRILGTLTTVAPYQDSDSLGPDHRGFPRRLLPAIVPAESQRLKATMAL